jgi:hypothetical protein
MNLSDKSAIVTGPVREGEPIKMRRLLTVRAFLSGDC